MSVLHLAKLIEVSDITEYYYCCYCCYSVSQSCQTLCDPMDCSTPGSPVLHYLPELAQIHVDWVGDSI